MIMIPMAISQMENEEDRELLLRLINEHGSLMFGIALTMLKNEEAARDMMSDACLTLMKKIDFLRTLAEEKQKIYICAIVKNNCRMEQRKRSRERLFANAHELETKLISKEDVDAALINEVKWRLLREALQRVDERSRDILIMKYYEKRSDAEIAEVLKVQKSSVRQYLSLARNKLKKELIHCGWFE